jgi:hypothetical protein
MISDELRIPRRSMPNNLLAILGEFFREPLLGRVRKPHLS